MKIKWFVFAAILAALCSCSKSGDIQYLPFQSDEDSNWGLVSTDGKVLFENEFKNEPTVVMHDRFFVKNADGKWELYSAQEKPEEIGKNVYDQAGAFIEDVAPVVATGQPIQFINKDGEVKFSLGNVDGQQITECTNFSEGIAVFKAGKYYGCIDKDGKVIVKPEYIRICPASDGKILAINKKYENAKNGDALSITVLSTSGKVISDISTKPFNDIDKQFHDGALVVEQKIDDENRQGLINEKGEFILRPSSKIHRIEGIENEEFIFYDGDNYGVMDFKGNVVIRPKYKRLTFAGKGKLLWAVDDKEDANIKLIDEDENVISKSEYEGVLPFHGSSAAVQVSKNSWIFIDEKCNEKKINEDIYNIDDSEVGDNIFYSQYVDVEALVKSINLQKTGFLGISLNMNASGILKALSALSEGDMSMEPSNYDGDYSIQNSFGLSRVDVNLSANFDESIVSPIESTVTDEYGFTYSETTGYQFKNITPNQIGLEIPRRDLMKGRMSKTTTALIKKIKELGSVYKENNNAAIVKVGNLAYFIANTGQAIEIVFGNLDISDIDISAYADVTEDSDVAMPAVEENADTAAFDSDYLYRNPKYH